MTDLSRRRLLTLSGGVAAGSLLPPSVHAALAEPFRPGGLGAIEHVVILMQENRSFDNYFGTLRGVRGFGDPAALKGVFEQSGVLPFSAREAAERANRPGSDIQYLGSLDHSWDGGQAAWANGWNNGWVPAKSKSTMAYYDRRDIPFQYELAETFTLCDAYHCSVFGPTNPNRLFMWSGNVGYEPGTNRRVVDNDAYDEDTHPGYSWTTYAERLESHGVSWKTYQEWDNYQDNALEFFVRFKEIARKALQPLGLKSMDRFYANLFKAAPAEREELLEQLDAGVRTLNRAERSLYDRALARVRPGELAKAFRADIESGKLPKVSYLVPSAADSEHPSASSPAASAKLTYDILDAIASNPRVWAKTALILTFDEFDGYFDHVPPPVPPAARTEEFEGGKPIGLGFRVPTTVISPWSIGGYVSSETFDHTSIVQFLERWTGVYEPNISAWRRTVSGDLTSTFDFRHAGRRPQLDKPGPVPTAVPRWKPAPPDKQSLPEQEPGTRPARPVPYRPEAWARLEGRTLVLTLRNFGTRSAHFAVYPYGKEFDAPKHVDVLGLQIVRIPLPGKEYNIEVHGPAGFRRTFASRVG